MHSCSCKYISFIDHNIVGNANAVFYFTPFFIFQISFSSLEQVTEEDIKFDNEMTSARIRNLLKSNGPKSGNNNERQKQTTSTSKNKQFEFTCTSFP